MCIRDRIEDLLGGLIVVNDGVRGILVLIKDMRARKLLLKIECKSDMRADVVKWHFCRSAEDGRT